VSLAAGGPGFRPGAATAKLPWGFILLLGCSSGLSAFGMASVVPALPTLERALHQDYSSLQFVVSAYLLGLGLFQPVQGMLCDRFGRRPVLLAGFSVFLMASLLASSAQSLPALVAARFLQAMGVSVATVVTRAIVRDSFEPERAAVALAFITAVMGVAPVIAPLAGGLLAGLFGWRAIFWMHATIAGLLVALMFFQLRETLPSSTQALPWKGLFGGFALLVSDPGFRGHTLTYSFVSGGSFVFVTIGADLFEKLYGMSSARFGSVWASLAVAYVAGAALAGTLARRLGSARVLRLGMRLYVVATLLFGANALLAAPPLAGFIGALALLMLSNSLISPLSLAGAVSDHPQLAGIAAGLSSAIAMLVSMLCAALIGLVYVGRPAESAWLLLASAVCAALALRTALRHAPPDGRSRARVG
jgi:DHA1 family bicyclomycin/chloramphenicol resistance-like MFS transporter